MPSASKSASCSVRSWNPLPSCARLAHLRTLRGLTALCIAAHMQVPFEDRQYQVGDPPSFDKTVWIEAKAKLEKQGLEFPNLPYIIDTDGTGAKCLLRPAPFPP